VIDDARVPERPFSVKCPKCQNVVRLPGKGASASAPAPNASPSPGPAAAPAASAPAPPPPSAETPAFETSSASEGNDEVRALVMAQLRREMSAEGGGGAGRALVALPDRGHAGAITVTLSRLGYSVDTVDDWEEGARLLEQGVYALAVAARVAGAAGKGESLYQRINRLNPEARRRVFVVLAGDEFKSGDGTQAFACLADAVLNSRDVGNADSILRNAIGDRTRLYQAFHDARKRFEASSG
jgi:hypothetical protein